MITTTTSTAPEQLSLLPAATVPVRFRLDEATRRRGLAHVAAIRSRLEQTSKARATPPRRRHVAAPPSGPARGARAA